MMQGVAAIIAKWREVAPLTATARKGRETVNANQMQLVELYEGNVLSNNARTAMETSG